MIAALPDSVVAQPLGPVEAREPRGARGAAARRAASAERRARSRAPRSPRRCRRKLEPQLATLVAAPPSGDWIVETKFDGYRLMARIEQRQGRS